MYPLDSNIGLLPLNYPAFSYILELQGYMFLGVGILPVNHLPTSFLPFCALNEIRLQTNWLYNVVRRQKLQYIGHVTRRNGLEKTLMRGMVPGKDAEESQNKDGRNASQIRLVRWQQQAEWPGTGIHFAETSGQRRPDEDMLREKTIVEHIIKK